MTGFRLLSRLTVHGRLILFGALSVAFTAAVVIAGMIGTARVWEGVRTLPTLNEITQLESRVLIAHAAVHNDVVSAFRTVRSSAGTDAVGRFAKSGRAVLADIDDHATAYRDAMAELAKIKGENRLDNVLHAIAALQPRVEELLKMATDT